MFSYNFVNFSFLNISLVLFQCDNLGKPTSAPSCFKFDDPTPRFEVRYSHFFLSDQIYRYLAFRCVKASLRCVVVKPEIFIHSLSDLAPPGFLGIPHGLKSCQLRVSLTE